jgi:hypothetical protein
VPAIYNLYTRKKVGRGDVNYLTFYVISVWYHRFRGLKAQPQHIDSGGPRAGRRTGRRYMFLVTNQRNRVIVDPKSDYRRPTLRAEHVFQLALYWVKGIISTIQIDNEKYMVLSFISQGCLETGNSCKLENKSTESTTSRKFTLWIFDFLAWFLLL